MWNDADGPRLVLVVDLWHPNLDTDDERLATLDACRAARYRRIVQDGSPLEPAPDAEATVSAEERPSRGRAVAKEPDACGSPSPLTELVVSKQRRALGGADGVRSLIACLDGRLSSPTPSTMVASPTPVAVAIRAPAAAPVAVAVAAPPTAAPIATPLPIPVPIPVAMPAMAATAAPPMATAVSPPVVMTASPAASATVDGCPHPTATAASTAPAGGDEAAWVASGDGAALRALLVELLVDSGDEGGGDAFSTACSPGPASTQEKRVEREGDDERRDDDFGSAQRRKGQDAYRKPSLRSPRSHDRQHHYRL